MTVFGAGGEDYTLNDPNIADEFSSSAAYAVGDYVNYQGNLYAFKAEHAAGAWNAAHVEAVKLGKTLRDVKSAITSELAEGKYVDLVTGTINSQTGAEVTNRANRRMSDYMPSNVIRITTDTGYEGLLYAFDKTTEDYIGCWDGNSFSATNSPVYRTEMDAQYPEFKLRIVLRATDDSDLSIADNSHIHYYYMISSQLFEHGKSADARIVGENINYLSKSLSGSNSIIPFYTEQNTDNFQRGAIGSTGDDNNTNSYVRTSYRYNGFLPLCDATRVLSKVEQVAPTDYYNYVLFYDGEYTYIERQGGKTISEVLAVVPENAKYCRVSLTLIKENSDTTTNIKSYVLAIGYDNTLQLQNSPKNKWYVLGDSISAGYYSMTESMAEEAGVELDYVSPVTTEQGETTGSVYDKSLEHNYWGYANKWRLHRDLVGKAYPGQGYFRTAANDQNGVYVVTHNDFSDAGLITVAWGFNDWHYNKIRGNHDLIDPSVPYPGENYDTAQISTVNQAIWFCLGELIRQAPNAKIIVQTPMNGWAYGGDWSTNWGIEYAMSNSGTLANIHDDVVYWANYYGLQILDMTYNNSVVNRRNIKDTIIDGSHPSDAAHQQLARHVAVALQYG